MKPLLIYDPKKKKQIKVGTVVADTLFRTVKNEHFCFKYHGYGIQLEALAKITEMEIKKVVIKAKNKEYETTVDDWKLFGTVDDLGHGMQNFLNIDIMRPHENALEKKERRELERLKT